MNSNPKKNTTKTLAFVSGYVGKKKHARIPKKPPRHDSYFITDNKWVYYRLKFTRWKPVFIKDTAALIAQFSPESPVNNFSEEAITTDKVTAQRYYTTACKPLKVYPQHFLKKKYDYLVWSDNKFDINYKDTIKVVNNWNPDIAMMLHRHPVLKNIDGEFEESMLQERYVIEKEQYTRYIKDRVNEGLSSQSDDHYQCGYLLYNMKASETENIQKAWHQNINQCGINDQISFNFVAQKFRHLIDEYKYDIDRKPLRKRIFK
ncbi:hypothetical protein ACFSTE_15465 [Aquimarina hainanensis]|uniref:Sulfotransferase family protein n=1 Tax=Aquimarina hainanensis TaxID=1578017 RepID=A0ABW5N9D2_9FLAO|nr:hypothetical protein [Aquimarina sp. TRL1]QKX03446.1 hypothetical protein HN014_00435 [Aquimarina sp. TRL1]